MAAVSSFTPLIDRGEEMGDKPIAARAKKEISTTNIRGILMNEKYMKRLRPLISDAVGEASINKLLIAEISELFTKNADKDSALGKALKALQKELELINDEYVPAEPTSRISHLEKSEGGGRRRTKNAYFYNKRRKTRRRKGKK
jgi:hypothetical protein